MTKTTHYSNKRTEDIFKKLFGMYKQEFAPLTEDEIAFVESPDALPEKSGGLGTPEETHKEALSGSRIACARLSLDYHPKDPGHSYLWAAIALLAGDRKIVSWMRTLDHEVPRDRRWYLVTIARKWYNLRKEDFARVTADVQRFACELGPRDS